MKRIFTLMLAVVAIATSASAVNLWKGSYTPNVSPASECPKIEAKTFADTKVGAALVFTLTPAEGDGWKALELWSDGVGCVLNYGKIVSTQTKIEIPINEEFLGKLKTYGFFPGGTDYTLTSIDLNDSYDGVLWTGVGELKDWNSSVSIAASYFSLIKDGYTLCVEVAPIDVNPWCGIWVSLGNGKGNISPNLEEELASRPILKYQLTNEQVNLIKTNGLYFTGANVKLTKVYVEGEGITTGVFMPGVDARVNAAVYTMTGVKVAASLDEAGKLAPGIYVSGGKKFVVR